MMESLELARDVVGVASSGESASRFPAAEGSKEEELAIMVVGFGDKIGANSPGGWTAGLAMCAR